jgi:hypothetical protein
MSAVVIPTATDLAYGLRFVADRLIEPPSLSTKFGCYWPPTGPAHTCHLRPAISLTDFAEQPVREFHRKMIHCLATDMHSADPNFLRADDASGTSECNHLTYNMVSADAN